MKIRLLLGCVLVCIGIMISKFSTGAAFTTCTWSDPDVDWMGKHAPSLPFCNLVDNWVQMRLLIKFLKRQSMTYERVPSAVLAADYGSFVQAAYIPLEKWILINPALTWKSDKINTCTVQEVGFTSKILRSFEITFVYLDEDGIERTRSAQGLEACTIQSIIDHF